VRDDRCIRPKCPTNVPPSRPFCTWHEKKLPYAIRKRLWGPEKDAATQDGIHYLIEVEAK